MILTEKYSSNSVTTYSAFGWLMQNFPYFSFMSSFLLVKSLSRKERLVTDLSSSGRMDLEAKFIRFYSISPFLKNFGLNRQNFILHDSSHAFWLSIQSSIVYTVENVTNSTWSREVVWFVPGQWCSFKNHATFHDHYSLITISTVYKSYSINSFITMQWYFGLNLVHWWQL